MATQHLKNIIVSNLETPTSFDTDWIANSDWTNNLLGSTVGANLVHELGRPITELDIKIFVEGINESSILSD
jgi:hypothetical protein